MLHAGSHAFFLNALYIRHRHLRREERVLAHILEVAAAERCAEDVHPGCEQDGLAPEAGLLAHVHAVAVGHFAVPRGREAGQVRVCGAGVVGMPRPFPLVPEVVLTDAERAVAHPYVGYAEPRNSRRGELGLGAEQRDLFFEGEPRERVLDTGLDGGGGVKIDRGAALCASGTEQHRRQKMVDGCLEVHYYSVGVILTILRLLM